MGRGDLGDIYLPQWCGGNGRTAAPRRQTTEAADKGGARAEEG